MRIISQLIGIIILWSTMSAHATSNDTLTNNHQITILTLNLANYNDHLDWEKRLELIANKIQESDADIIALQENRFDPDQSSTTLSYQDMAQQILFKLNQRGDFLDASLVTQPAMYYSNSTQPELGTHNYPLPSTVSPTHQSFYWEGLSIISKLPILETGNIFLSMPANCQDKNKRITQYIKVQFNNDSLYIANIHFAYDPICTLSNTKETLQYLNTFVNDKPFIMLGDFNATPDNTIFKELSHQGLHDVWLKLRPNENGNTATSSSPLKRIDYIFANDAVLNYIKDSSQIWLFGNKPESGTFPSDHLGIALKLK